jgi:agmatinase
MSKGFDPNAAAPADSGIYGLPFTVDEARVVFVPVPFDATTSYGKGAADGPRAIFEASKQVDLFDLETGKPYEAGLAMMDMPAEVRAWNDGARVEAEKIITLGGDIGDDPALARALAAVNETSRRVNEWVHAQTKRCLDAGKIPCVVGGDHSVPFGAIRAYADAFDDFGILHFDAHADLRPAYEGFEFSHASIMHNVITRLPRVQKLVQIGIRDFSEQEHAMIRASDDRIVTFFDVAMKKKLRGGTDFDRIAADIAAALPKHVYISFDIDGLDPTLCPHTGTPVPGGLSLDQALAIVAEVVRQKKTIVGLDLNEVAPGPDGDEWDANVGARLLYKLVGWMLVSRGLSRAP